MVLSDNSELKLKQEKSLGFSRTKKTFHEGNINFRFAKSGVAANGET